MSIVEKALEKAHRRRAPEPAGQAAEVDVRRLQPLGAATPDADQGGALVRTASSADFIPLKQLRLDREQLRGAGVLPPQASERRLAAEYRRIKRPLVARALDPDPERDSRARVIMVASAVPGEGKTFTSFNLALSLSLEKDVHVLLVDADVAKPHISQLLGLASEPGLLDLLRDDSPRFEDVAYGTDVPGLSVLPAGRRSDTDTELLASRRMHDLMSSLIAGDARRVVVLDYPPLLLTSESRELATAAGQVVLVVRAGETPQQAVLDAVQVVGEGRPIGVVLNQLATGDDAGAYYGYGAYGTYPSAAST